MFIQENAFENGVCEMASICLGLNVLVSSSETPPPLQIMRASEAIEPQMCRTGTHFTNDFSLVIQIRGKFHSTLIQVQVMWSLWNFAHGTTASLRNFWFGWKIIPFCHHLSCSTLQMNINHATLSILQCSCKEWYSYIDLYLVKGQIERMKSYK